MRVIIENLAKNCMDDIFYYNVQYSLKNAVKSDKGINKYIRVLENSPYIGRIIPEMFDKSFREIIYPISKKSRYRIMYYVSEISNVIYVFYIINCKQDFYRILKSYNYFKNYFNI